MGQRPKFPTDQQSQILFLAIYNKLKEVDFKKEWQELKSTKDKANHGPYFLFNKKT